MHEVVQTLISFVAEEARELRFNFAKDSPKAYRAMLETEDYLHRCGLDKCLLGLIKLRISQINGCAFCIDMHWKDSRACGESEARLYSLAAWRQCPYYSDRERAALSLAEGLTRIADGHVPDSVYEEAHQHFTNKELADLSLAVSSINAWNRVLIAAGKVPGTYTCIKQTAIPDGIAGNPQRHRRRT